MRTAALLTALVLSGLAPMTAQAQTREFKLDGKAIKPKKVLARPGTDQPWDVWVAYENYAPLWEHGKDNDPVSGEALKFMGRSSPLL